MENWLVVLLVIIGLVAVIFLLAVFSGSIVVWAANRFYKKQEKELVNKALAELPHTDCGNCGCTSCAAYAALWGKDRKDPGKCPFLSEEKKESILSLIREQDEYVEQRLSTRPKNDRLGKRRLWMDSDGEEDQEQRKQ